MRVLYASVVLLLTGRITIAIGIDVVVLACMGYYVPRLWVV